MHRPMRSSVLSLYVVTWMPVGSSLSFFGSSKMVWYTLSGMMLISAQVSTLILKQSFASSSCVFAYGTVTITIFLSTGGSGSCGFFDLVHFGTNFDLARLISHCWVVLVFGHFDFLLGL